MALGNTYGDEHGWPGHVDGETGCEETPEVDAVHHESDEETETLVGKTGYEHWECVFGWLGLCYRRGECADQHRREDGQDPARQDVRDDEFLHSEKNVVVYNCVKGGADRVDPEGVSKGSDKPGSRVWDTVSGGIGDHCRQTEPESCGKEALMWVCEGMGEPGCITKRVVIVMVTNVKKKRFVTNIPVPSPVRPANRYAGGITDRTKATPPVDIVHAYHANVKCFNRNFKSASPT
jgi:hypothetical protein